MALATLRHNNLLKKNLCLSECLQLQVTHNQIQTGLVSGEINYVKEQTGLKGLDSVYEAECCRQGRESM